MCEALGEQALLWRAIPRSLGSRSAWLYPCRCLSSFFSKKKHDVTVMVVMKINSLLLLSLFLKRIVCQAPPDEPKGAMDHASLTVRLPSVTAGSSAAGLNPKDVCTVVKRAAVAKRSAKLFVLPLPKMSHFVTRSTRQIRPLDSAPLRRHLRAATRAAGAAEEQLKRPQGGKERNKERGRLTDQFPHFVSESVLNQRSLVHVLFFLHLCFLVRTLGLLPHYSVYRETHIHTHDTELKDILS